MIFDFVSKPDFWRWYLSLAEIAFGLGNLAWAPAYENAYTTFKRELKDPAIGERFRAVVDRRKKLENLSPVPRRIVGGIGILLGGATLFTGLPPTVSFALMSLCVGVMLAVTLVGMRNRGERRVAALVPRSSTSQVPIWVYLLTALVAIAPLAYAGTRELRFPSIIVSIVGLLLIACAAFMSSNMSSLLTGEDAPVELVIDERLRCLRIGTCVNLAAGSAFIFMSMTMAMHMVHTPMPVIAGFIASLASLALWFGYTRKWQIPPKLTAAQLDG